MNDTLDELLASAAPAVSPFTPDADAALAVMVADARVAALRGRRAKVARRVGGTAAVIGLMAVGTAAAAGVLPLRSEEPSGWNGLTDEAARTVQIFEWTSTHPVNQTCVERLSGWGLTDAEVAGIKTTLSDPARLLVNDDGAVRREFLDRGWATDSTEDTAAIDAAYAEVAKLDFAAGRGTLSDGHLTGAFLTDRYDELYDDIYWRLILDGIGAGPHGYHQHSPGMQSLDPATACVVSK